VSRIRRELLMPQTSAVLRLQRHRNSEDNSTRFYGCGCIWYMDEGQMELCPWHEGFDLGVEAADPVDGRRT
jgi:hypothetical protein